MNGEPGIRHFPGDNEPVDSLRHRIFVGEADLIRSHNRCGSLRRRVIVGKADVSRSHKDYNRGSLSGKGR